MFTSPEGGYIPPQPAQNEVVKDFESWLDEAPETISLEDTLAKVDQLTTQYDSLDFSVSKDSLVTEIDETLAQLKELQRIGSNSPEVNPAILRLAAYRNQLTETDLN
jgi:hypothetical protein